MLLSLLNDISSPYHYLLIIILNTSDDKCDTGHGLLSSLDNAFEKVTGFLCLHWLWVRISAGHLLVKSRGENDEYQWWDRWFEIGVSANLAWEGYMWFALYKTGYKVAHLPFAYKINLTGFKTSHKTTGN